MSWQGNSAVHVIHDYPQRSQHRNGPNPSVHPPNLDSATTLSWDVLIALKIKQQVITTFRVDH